MKKQSIKIKKSKKGTFTKAAKKRDMSVQEFASKVMSNKDGYSTAMVKKANFAKNATKFKHELGGVLSGISGPVGAGLSLINPLLGSAASSLLGAVGGKISENNAVTKTLQNHFNSLSESTNPYGQYEKGGVISGYEDLLKYDGDSHSSPSGGIDVNDTGLPVESSKNQVEDDEVVFRMGQKAVVFSKKLKI